jgi:hypothetical protein
LTAWRTAVTLARLRRRDATGGPGVALFGRAWLTSSALWQ